MKLNKRMIKEAILEVLKESTRPPKELNLPDKLSRQVRNELNGWLESSGEMEKFRSWDWYDKGSRPKTYLGSIWSDVDDDSTGWTEEYFAAKLTKSLQSTGKTTSNLVLQPAWYLFGFGDYYEPATHGPFDSVQACRDYAYSVLNVDPDERDV